MIQVRFHVFFLVPVIILFLASGSVARKSLECLHSSTKMPGPVYDCDGYFPMDSECWLNKCPHRSWTEFSDLLELSLRREVIGQDDAIQQIMQAVRGHVSNKPLVLHFAGDNGVGKTMAGKIFARSFFRRERSPNTPEGYLKLEGEHYSSSINSPMMQERDRSEMHEKTVSQLAACPASIIFIDEVQKVHPAVLSVLVPLMQSETVLVDNKNLDLRRAIFIFTSDFGNQGVVRSVPFESREEFVRESVRKAWGERFKLNTLSICVIPFSPLMPSDFEAIAHRSIQSVLRADIDQFKGLSRICFDRRLPSLIANVAFSKYPNENARSVEKVMYKIRSSISSSIQEMRVLYTLPSGITTDIELGVEYANVNSLDIVSEQSLMAMLSVTSHPNAFDKEDL